MLKLSQHHFYTLRAWAVHLYTSLGLIVALFAVAAVARGDALHTFLLLGVAMFIDATDGVFARRWCVTTWAAGLDGRKLDDITDYITYAFIPVFFAYQFKMVEGLGVAILGLVLICAAYGFTQKVAKTTDGFFTGFPNFWNLLVFYLFLFRVPPTVTALIMLFFALMIFVPIKYVSYSTKSLRAAAYLISLVYGLFLAAILATWNNLDIRLVWASLAFPLLYGIVSLHLYLKQEGRSIFLLGK